MKNLKKILVPANDRLLFLAVATLSVLAYLLIAPEAEGLGVFDYRTHHSLVRRISALLAIFVAVYCVWISGDLRVAVKALLLFFFLLTVEKICLGSMFFFNVESYALIVVCLIGLVILIARHARGPFRRFLLSTIGIAVYLAVTFGSAFLVYSVKFDTQITRTVFYAIEQSNPSEMFAYLTSQLGFMPIAGFLVLNLTALWLIFSGRTRWQGTIRSSVVVVIVAASLIWFAVMHDNRHTLRLARFAYNASAVYHQELRLFLKEQAKREAIGIVAEKKEFAETYLVVFGESQNKFHMSLYGYPRKTTPLLDKRHEDGGVLVFSNAIACHTHTDPVMSKLLTEANQYNQSSYYSSASIIEVLKAAGFKTYWLTNQALLGKYGNMVSVLAHQSDQLCVLNRAIGTSLSTQRQDGELVEHVRRILDEEEGENRVIFVHLMGSHWDYCKRFPQEFNVFRDDMSRALIGENVPVYKTNMQRLNCYDNSVRYNDFVIDEMISLLEKRQGVSGFIYLSDHGEDVLEESGHDFSSFTYPMLQIPMIAWFSDEYTGRYPERFRRLSDNTRKLFTNDLVYDTLLGVCSVTTDRYASVYDLSSGKYHLDYSQALFYDDRHYCSKKKSYCHQVRNGEILMAQGQAARVLPHRVNTIGKLMELWSKGFRSFEVDVLFRPGTEITFEVGHDSAVMAGISLEQFLDSINSSELVKIWLDVKNPREESVAQMCERLGYLDKKFRIRDKLLLEVPDSRGYVRQFADAGFHLSYYLPTATLKKLLDDEDRDGMRRWAEDISKAVTAGRFAAVSFDWGLYPFVRNYLKPRLENDVVFHLWDLSNGLNQPKMWDWLQQSEYFSDPKVKTILLPYASPYDL